jgi:predicted HAD superfamily phosphohydrolase YqeG
LYEIHEKKNSELKKLHGGIEECRALLVDIDNTLLASKTGGQNVEALNK